MKRYELLRELFERGINRFNVYRLTEFRRPKRFPVFIRDENEHGLIYSKLLNSPQRLDAEIKRILESGQTRENKIIVEYLQTSDTTGIFRKYASFMVGGKIIPRHLFFGDQWDVRYNSNNCLDAARLAEEKHYVEQNPHEGFLNEIFRMARISYGRIDYSVLDGKPQIWEINTNPCLFPLDTGMEIAARKDLAALFASRMEREFTRLDEMSPPNPGRIPIHRKKTGPLRTLPFFHPKVLNSNKKLRPYIRLLPPRLKQGVKKFLNWE
jgi:hypothetical protein